MAMTMRKEWEAVSRRRFIELMVLVHEFITMNEDFRNR